MFNNKPIAIFLENLGGGGIEQTVIKLTNGMHHRGIRVNLLLRSQEGELSNLLDKEVKTVNFSKSRIMLTLFPLIKYLWKEKPVAIISNGSSLNIVTLIASKLIRNYDTRLILTERNNIFKKKRIKYKLKITLFLMRWLYPKGGVLVGVSNGVSRRLERFLRLEKGSVKTVYNGVVDNNFFDRVDEPLKHEWFQKDNPPVLVAVGRLVEQKDFSNLLQAFALLRKTRKVRLIILGEGELRSQLESLVDQLDLKDDVSMPGFEINPLKYLKRCSAFVFSSKWEGLAGVVVEALACGCPIVATNCPSGPAEVLENGKYGQLVRIGKPKAMAEAIGKILDYPPDSEPLIERAKLFSVENAVSNYLSLIRDGNSASISN